MAKVEAKQRKLAVDPELDAIILDTERRIERLRKGDDVSETKANVERPRRRSPTRGKHKPFTPVATEMMKSSPIAFPKPAAARTFIASSRNIVKVPSVSVVPTADDTPIASRRLPSPELRLESLCQPLEEWSASQANTLTERPLTVVVAAAGTPVGPTNDTPRAVESPVSSSWAHRPLLRSPTACDVRKDV